MTNAAIEKQGKGTVRVDNATRTKEILKELVPLMQHEAIIAHLNKLDEGLGDFFSQRASALDQYFTAYLEADTDVLLQAGRLIGMQRDQIEDQRAMILMLQDELYSLEKDQIKQAPRLIAAEMSGRFGIFNHDARRFIEFLLGKWDLGEWYDEEAEARIKEWITDTAEAVFSEQATLSEDEYDALTEGIEF